MSTEYAGLVLIARSGVPWRWAGHEVVCTKRGERVRVELWRAPCRACGQDFSVAVRLSSKLRVRYLTAFARAQQAGQAPDVRIVLPRDLRVPGFELRNCRAHRGRPDPEALV